jgi:hypothetical protein
MQVKYLCAQQTNYNVISEHFMSDNIFSEFDFEPGFDDTPTPKKIKTVKRSPSGFLGMSLGQTALITIMFFFTVTIIGTMVMVGLGKMSIF